jgi:hypothetical protein
MGRRVFVGVKPLVVLTTAENGQLVVEYMNSGSGTTMRSTSAPTRIWAHSSVT